MVEHVILIAKKANKLPGASCFSLYVDRINLMPLVPKVTFPS